jgi:hypothetical protein
MTLGGGESSNASFAAGGFTIENRPMMGSREGYQSNLKRGTGEVLKSTVMEMREMSEVMKELGNLIG